MTDRHQILLTRVDEFDLVETITQQSKVEKYVFEYVGLFMTLRT